MALSTTGPLLAPLREATSANSSIGPISGSRVPSPSEKGQPRPRAVVTTKDISIKILPAAVLLILVFWANLSNLLGAFYKQGNHTKRAHVPLVDFDGGAFGQAMIASAASLNQTYQNPTYIIVDPSTTSPEQLRRDVFSGKYWTAIYTLPGASGRWTAATAGTSTTAYDSTAVWAHVTFTARYYSFYEGNFYAPALNLLGQAGAIFSETVAGPALANATALNSAAAQTAFVYPAQTVEIFATGRDFTAANKALVNTIGTVMPIIMQFFFTMAWNGISNGLHLFAAFDTRRHITWRCIISAAWPLVSSLCVTGWTWAFKGDYSLPAKEFFAYWAITWVFCIINIDLIDVLTTWIPIGFVPPFFLTWIITNVVSTIVPPSIANPWYAVHYFFPGLHWWQGCITIFSQGGNSHLNYNLPVLAAWLIIAKAASIFATTKRIKLGREAFAADPTHLSRGH